MKEDTLWNCVFKPRNNLDQGFHPHLLLLAIAWVLEKRARTTAPNPEKVTMTERTCLPLESDIRKMQLFFAVQNSQFASIRRLLPRFP